MTSPRALLLAAAAPAIALTVARLAMLLAALAGAHPFWRVEPLNLAEAAALRDAGEVARLIASGQDPNGTYTVRAGVLGSDPAPLTPVAAAMAARRGEIVTLLIDAGATPPATIVDHDRPQ